jgi:hypothetical protein
MTYISCARKIAPVYGGSHQLRSARLLYMHSLPYEAPADVIDDYVRMVESTCFNIVTRFFMEVVQVFGPDNLRAPNEEDTTRILAQHEVFLECSGVLTACTGVGRIPHLLGKGCKGAHREYSVILEAVVDYDLWIWHALFGMAGTRSDINVLQHSSVFAILNEGHAPPFNFEINGHTYNKGYLSRVC